MNTPDNKEGYPKMLENAEGGFDLVKTPEEAQAATLKTVDRLREQIQQVDPVLAEMTDAW